VEAGRDMGWREGSVLNKFITAISFDFVYFY